MRPDQKPFPFFIAGRGKQNRSLHELAEGQSTIGKNVREGFVMRSVPESWHSKLGRRIIKCKGKQYKITKG